jgi:hypothetical protein
MKSSKFPLILAACVLSFAGVAHADCAFPKAPAAIPNGTSASEPEMVAAMQAFKTYDADVKAFGTCLDTETQARIKEGGAGMSATEIRELKTIQTKKNNTAVDELQTKVKEFNEQVRAFKSKG